MDLFDVVRSLFRRWYVFLPLLLVAIWCSYSVYGSVKPVYYSQALIGIAPPSTKVANPPSGAEVPRNGLLDIGGAPMIANMVSTTLRDASVVDQVVAGGGLPDYNSRMFPGPANMGQLPLILIEATNADPTAVTRTLELVIAQSDKNFRSLQGQARVPEDQMVTAFVVSPPSVPKAGMPARTRSTAAIFVAGAGLAVLLTVMADVLLTRRKSRGRNEEPEAETQPAAHHKRKKEEEVEFDDGAEDTSAKPSILRSTDGRLDTLSVSVADLISWARAQSEDAAPNTAHPPHDNSQVDRAAPPPRV